VVINIKLTRLVVASAEWVVQAHKEEFFNEIQMVVERYESQEKSG